MYTLILSERQKYRVLPTLLEAEELHLAQCNCPDDYEMLGRLREDIAELKAMLSKPPPKQCREQWRGYLLSPVKIQLQAPGAHAVTLPWPTPTKDPLRARRPSDRPSIGYHDAERGDCQVSVPLTHREVIRGESCMHNSKVQHEI
jgi:hypothetical protein